MNHLPHSLNFGRNRPNSYSTTHLMFLLTPGCGGCKMAEKHSSYVGKERTRAGKVESIHPPIPKGQHGISQTQVQSVQHKDQDVLFM
jgi:hypothetical protein